MFERIVAKNRFPRGHLAELMADRCPGWSYSVEEMRAGWTIRVFSDQTDADLDQVLDEAESYPDFSILRAATITELAQGQAKPIRVKRGNHEAWCYATAPMQALLAANKIAVGNKVLVGFIDSDRSMPVVVG